jgi:hypothetical protein
LWTVHFLNRFAVLVKPLSYSGFPLGKSLIKQVTGKGMQNKKPDALLILAVLFAAGVLFSAISHGGGEAQRDLAGYPGVQVPAASR